MHYWKKILLDPDFEEFIAGLRIDLDKSWSKWSKRITGLRSQADLSRLIQTLVKLLIQKTTRGLTWSGTDAAWLSDPHQAAIFLSNHRSTSLDPILISYCLLRSHGRRTYVAAGDNVFRSSWLGHLIRLNQGFIVKRHVPDPDEKLIEADRLSLYINKLVDDQQWVWIAHRNGRSKDGSDQTDSAILSMLRRGSRSQDWQELCSNAALAPVSVSWELVPLDLQLAQELAGAEIHAGPMRDLRNIMTEIGQEKGRIHIGFATPVVGDKRSLLVKAIDDGIHQNVRIWESNLLAWLRLNTSHEADGPAVHPAQAFLESNWNLKLGEWVLDRGRGLSPEAHRHFLEIYAAPVKNLLAHCGDFPGLLAHQRRLLAVVTGTTLGKDSVSA